jgi:hypothetical protein
MRPTLGPAPERTLKSGRVSATVQPPHAQNEVTKARILVIEDAEAINVAVCAALRDNGLNTLSRDGFSLPSDTLATKYDPI